MSVVATSGNDPVLAKSRAYCTDITRRQAKNFYYGLKLLPEPKRSAMYALYAYMRLVDDIADAEDGRTKDQRIAELEHWRAMTHAALAGETIPGGESEWVWPAFGQMARQYGVPRKIFDDMIAGQRQDLEPVAIETFQQLYEYCYRVASVVGLASIYVWGFEGGVETQKLAVERGIALQLTNVLRDLQEDAGKGRVYVPSEDLRRFGVSAQELAQGQGGEKFRDLMKFQLARAQGYYQRSATLEGRVSPDSRATLWAMTEIYHGLLRKMIRDPERVLRGRVSLSVLEKLMIGWRAMRGKGGQ